MVQQVVQQVVEQVVVQQVVVELAVVVEQVVVTMTVVEVVAVWLALLGLPQWLLARPSVFWGVFLAPIETMVELEAMAPDVEVAQRCLPAAAAVAADLAVPQDAKGSTAPGSSQV